MFRRPSSFRAVLVGCLLACLTAQEPTRPSQVSTPRAAAAAPPNTETSTEVATTKEHELAHRAWLVACWFANLGAQEPAPTQASAAPTAAEPPTKAPATTDLEELARRVDQAHRPRGPVPPIRALRADLTLHLLDPAAEQRGQVDLAVQFLLSQPEGKNKKESRYLRYEVRDAGKPIVRGRDQYGLWQLVQGKPRDLDAAEFPTDRVQLQSHIDLTHQLIRFLSPGDMLRSLREAGPVRDDALALERGKPKVPTRTVTGRLPSFPLVQKGGDDDEVELTIHVHAEKGTLLAIDATPIVDGKPVAARSERALLLDLRERDDLLVPHELLHLFRDDKGQLRPHSKAVLVTVQLRPELRVEDFDRDR